MNPLLIKAGLDLITTVASNSKEENEQKVKQVLSDFEDKPFYKSKRWYLTIAAILVPIINRATGLNLSEMEMVSIVGPVMAYVLGKSHEQKKI